jgi:myo-inositol-1(or 4)-monophosphatase
VSDEKPGKLSLKRPPATRPGPEEKAAPRAPLGTARKPRENREAPVTIAPRAASRSGNQGMRLSALLNVMVGAARKAGRRLLRDFGEVEQLQVSVKGPGDFVSQADLRAEETLREELSRARPHFGFLGEEGGEQSQEGWEYRWVIDPLDGTTNFLHGIPHWAISIGVEHRLSETESEIVAGVIYNPASDELFWSEKGSGVFLNDKRLRVSSRREMREAVFATGIPFAATPRKPEFVAILSRLMPQVAGVRRFGAAALDLAWVAAGRYDGYWELGLNKWDISAGLLMVREAGGFVTDPEGGDAYAEGHVVAGNPNLHGKLRQVVSEGIAAAQSGRKASRGAKGEEA